MIEENELASQMAIVQSISNLSGMLNRVMNHQDANDKKSDKRDDKIFDRLEEISATVHSINTRVSVMESGGTDNRVTENKAAIAAIEVRLTAIDTTLNNLRTERSVWAAILGSKPIAFIAGIGALVAAWLAGKGNL